MGFILPLFYWRDNILDLSRRVVLFTGKLSRYTRPQAQRVVKEKGGQAPNSFTKAVNLLVVGKRAGSKLNKALDRGVEIIYEEEFYNCIQNNTAIKEEQIIKTKEQYETYENQYEVNMCLD